jgi:hypothetical protein
MLFCLDLLGNSNDQELTLLSVDSGTG